eukprot:GHVR01033752.1.p1 GENE.GHVR01033752.1~~GHVR01033752.1.p1  ORF type:complete len:394 (-),score=44.04 GHVR01033752.1:105-1286(-)
MSLQTKPISAEELAGVALPIEQAHGMPNKAYADPNMLAFERDNIMSKTWAGLAFTSELPKKGYAKPVEFMGISLLIIRDPKDEIRVFHNVCSHRGMKLMQEETEIVGRIRCPYHSWTYDVEGELKGTPHIGGPGVHQVDGFSCEGRGLKAVRSAVWFGIIFINLSGEAERFDDFIAPLVERWEGFTGKGNLENVYLATTGSALELEVKANWKLPVENYCEAYHLPWVHPALNTYSPLDQHFNLHVNDYMSGQGTHVYNPAGISGTRLPQFSEWPEDKLQEAEYISLYPNVLLGLQVDHVFSIILQPLAHDHTVEKLQLLYVGPESVGDDYAANRTATLDSWRTVFGEDVFAVEGMQQGRQSPAFTGGMFSPVLDGPTHHFHQWVARHYGQADG